MHGNASARLTPRERLQWALNAWQNFAITGILLLLTFRLAWSRGYSPLEMVSRRADRAFVRTLRARFTSIPRRASASTSSGG